MGFPPPTVGGIVRPPQVGQLYVIDFWGRRYETLDSFENQVTQDSKRQGYKEQNNKE